MSIVQDWYESRSFGSHIRHTIFAPLQPVNPFFYIDFYESLEDDTTDQYVFGELVYASGWLFAASVHAYRTGAHLSPFKIMTDGLSISRYILQDAGMFSLPVTLPVLAMASAAGWIATAEHHGAVTPGVASGFGMPITNPGAAHSPTPYRQGLRDMFGLN